MRLAVLLDPFYTPRSRPAEPPEWGLKPADRAALEAAIALKHEYDAAALWAVSVNPVETDMKQAFTFCYVFGVDRVVSIPTEANHSWDKRTIAAILKEFMSLERPDLLLCGSDDASLACPVGSLLAGELNCPFVTGAYQLDWDDSPGAIIVQRVLDRLKRERLRVALPAVVALNSHLYTNQTFPSLLAIKKGMQKTADIYLPKTELRDDASCRTMLVAQGPRRIPVKEQVNYPSNASASTRMAHLIGTLPDSTVASSLLYGSADGTVQAVVRFLGQHGILSNKIGS